MKQLNIIENDQESAPNIRGSVILGGAITGLFAAVFLGWGATAPVASASIATGVVGVEGKTRVVQHLEGGIVSDILVRDGDKVDAGDILVRLDDTKARATYDLLSKRRFTAMAELARLEAEHEKLNNILFPNELVDSSDESTADMIKGQIAMFKSRKLNLLNQLSVLNERILEYKAEIVGLQGRMAADEEQLALTATQIKDVRGLLKEGLARKPRLLELEVQASEIESRIRHNRAQIARNQQRIEGSRASIAETMSKHEAQVAENLRKSETELLDMDERLRAAEDVLMRTEIVAPVTGVVTDLRVNTNGGVIAPGEPVANVVPEDENLIIEARVKPDDIDVVRQGLDAHVRFSALNQRSTAPVPGVVRTVSADRMLDENTGESYFLATVELNVQASEDMVELYPGMSAEVMIETGSRTALAYLFEPFTNSFNRAFREN